MQGVITQVPEITGIHLGTPATQADPPSAEQELEKAKDLLKRIINDKFLDTHLLVKDKEDIKDFLYNPKTHHFNNGISAPEVSGEPCIRWIKRMDRIFLQTRVFVEHGNNIISKTEWKDVGFQNE